MSRGTSPRGIWSILAAALVSHVRGSCLRIEAEESADGREAIHRLKAAFCVRYQETEVNRLQKELEPYLTWTMDQCENLKPKRHCLFNQNAGTAQVVAVTELKPFNLVTTPTHRSYALPRRSSHHTLYGQKVWISPIL